MQIVGYLKTSLIEWPGKIASVIFVPGCNFRCPFCQNRDLVDPSRIAGLQEISEQSFFADLKKRKKWVDAAVITGGEPTLAADLPEFLSKIKNLGFLTMIQTNGTKPKIINKLIIKKLTDYIAMDVKGDLENYSNYTNCSNDQIIENVKKSIKIIAGSGVEYEFRTTVVPGLHDLNNLARLAEEIAEEVQRCKGAKKQRSRFGPLNLCASVPGSKWYLQQFRPVNTLDPKYMKVEPYTGGQMKNFQKKLQKVFPHIYLRGVL